MKVFYSTDPELLQCLRVLLLRVRDSQGGFLHDTDVHELAKLDRLRMLLVRCGNGRFLCAVQDVKHFTEIITADGRDHVRDVSLPSNDRVYLTEYRGNFEPVTNDPPPPVPQTLRQYPALAVQQVAAQRDHFIDAYCDDRGDCYSDADSGL